ncbi:MAG: hypothetical protein ACPL7R_08320, partial [Anaerolineae bacterium]
MTRLFRILTAIGILAAVCAACKPAPAPLPTPVATPTTEQALALAELPARDPVQVARRLGKAVSGGALASPAVYRVGDRAEFWVSDTLYNTYRRATATLQW